MLWAEEARRRFDAQVLPLLSETALMLRVVLVLRDQESVLRLAADGHLGYYALQDSPAQTQQVVIFSGDTTGL